MPVPPDAIIPTIIVRQRKTEMILFLSFIIRFLRVIYKTIIAYSKSRYNIFLHINKAKVKARISAGFMKR